jgi:hypothetical protein
MPGGELRNLQMNRMIALFVLVNLMFAAHADGVDPGPRFVEYDPESLLPADAQQLATLRRHLSATGERAAFVERLRHIAHMRPAPMPLKHIVYEGRVSNDPQRIGTVEHLLDMDRLAAFVWLMRIEPDSADHRNGARDLLLAWARVYQPTGNDVNENKLAACFVAFDELRDHLSQAERAEVSRWLVDIARRNLANAPGLGGNRLAKANKILALAGRVCDDAELRDRAASLFGDWLEQVLHADGRSTDLDRRDAMHYHASALRDALEVASILHADNRDLFRLEGPKGQSLEKSLRYMLPYVRGEKIHPEWVNTTIALDRRRWEAGDEFYKPGKPWPRTQAIELLILAGRFDSEYLDLAWRVIAEERVTPHPFLELTARMLRRD